MSEATICVGTLLRRWRQRRRRSQLDLALEAGVSTRHLSFVETGRSRPSRDMVLHLAQQLDVPQRERNVLLAAAGYAAEFPERSLSHPDLAAARAAIDRILDAHDPNPALLIDRHWTLHAGNVMLGRLLAGLDPVMLKPPVNILRIALHPNGLAPRIVNLGEWRSHLLERLRGQIAATADPVLIALLEELSAYPSSQPGPGSPRVQTGANDIAVPFQLQSGDTVLSFLSTTMVFGTPLDVTLSELALESFLPADDATASTLRQIAAMDESGITANAGTSDVPNSG